MVLLDHVHRRLVNRAAFDHPLRLHTIPGMLFFRLLVALSVKRPVEPAAWDALRYEEYCITRNTQPVRDYIRGVGNAFDTMNFYLPQNGGARLFCGPRVPLPSLDIEQYLATIDDQAAFILSGGGNIKTLPIEALLLAGLVRRYPCK